jgi:hypothetical protein
MWRLAKPLWFFSDNVKEEYENRPLCISKKLALSCAQNKIKYVPVNVSDDLKKFY